MGKRQKVLSEDDIQMANANQNHNEILLYTF